MERSIEVLEALNDQLASRNEDIEADKAALIAENRTLLERIAALEQSIKRQAKAAISGMDAAKAVASSNLEHATRLHAECSPEALESERVANAQLTCDLHAALSREAALSAHIEGLKPALEAFANGLGTCCCGDDMNRHGDPMNAGHMPTDSGWYAMECYMRDKPDTSSLASRDSTKQTESLDRLGQLLKETHFDKAPSVARVVMQVNDAINRVKQEVRPLRLVSQSESGQYPDCELECSAYGTYCKCAAETQ